MNTNIYKAYTTIDNGRVKENLQYLAQHNMQAKCRIRLPLIKDYNTPTNVAASKKQLSAMGFTDFDEFEYRSN